MAIKQSEFKKILLKESIIYNFLLFLYPSIIALIVLLLVKFNVINFKMLKDFNVAISSGKTWQLILFFIVLPLVLSTVFAPLVSLCTSALQSIPNGLVSGVFLLGFLPANIICCLLIFAGSFFHFFISLIWERFKFEDDPHLFQWHTYIFISKPE